ncbi:MAG TPA: EF-P lysine aminoacylase EpmA [Gammaproteobacteria bacterium]|nr:EF-P lysine aminoacylase EpmA [Gammaproteobacteria bacterium]
MTNDADLAANLPWQPSASLDNLRKRAAIFAKIRQFFAERGVLEVETPLLCHTSVPDPYIQSIPTMLQQQPHPYYLQTSPEYAMKRLLAAGSGAIYQISKAFRQEEVGRWHNPEFSMLEWYRPGFDHHALMQEMDLLLQVVLATPPAEKVTYAQLFMTGLDLDPHRADLTTLANCAAQQQLVVAGEVNDKDTWLQLLMSHSIEPQLGKDCPCFVYDFPASQAALARIQPGPPAVAARFEVYFRGIELANGFHELQDAAEQRTRFEKNLLDRQQLGLALLPIDELLLAALTQGLPDCAGVALGLDRLVMLAIGSTHIAEVVSFDFSRA